MNLCLCIDKRAYGSAVRLLYLPHETVNADIALSLGGGNLMIPLQSVEEPAVALRRRLVLLRQLRKIFLQLRKALLEGVDPIPDHLERGGGCQLLYHRLHLSVRLPHLIKILKVHFHAVIAENTHRPAVLLRQLLPQIIQDLINISKSLFDAVPKIPSRRSHQGLIALSCLFISVLKSLSLCVEVSERLDALPLHKAPDDSCGQSRQFPDSSVSNLILTVPFDSIALLREILLRKLLLRLPQCIDQLLHRRGVNRKAALQQLHICLRSHM